MQKIGRAVFSKQCAVQLIDHQNENIHVAKPAHSDIGNPALTPTSGQGAQGPGIALILIGDVRSSRLGSRFVLNNDGSGEFHGLERRVRVFGLESSTALAIEEMFRDGAPVAPSGSSPENRLVESLEPSGG